jgi:hypothetical protein
MDLDPLPKGFFSETWSATSGSHGVEARFRARFDHVLVSIIETWV